MTRTRLLPFAFLVPAVALIGCSSGNSTVPAKVSGSISYKGQPIKAGLMAFHAPDQKAYDAQIGTDGTYSASDLPEGEMVITVDTEHLKPKPKGKDAERRSKMMQQAAQGAETPDQFYIKIPEKYGKTGTSPLTVTLVRGRQVHNIDLTD